MISFENYGHLRNLYLLHGANGVGKTYALKKAFGITEEETYTHTGIMRGYCQPLVKGNLIWAPEWRTRSDPLLNLELTLAMQNLILNSKEDIILDVSHRRKAITEMFCEHMEITHLVLSATDEEIATRNGSRKISRKSNTKTKEDTVREAIKTNSNLIVKYSNAMNQQELINFIERY